MSDCNHIHVLKHTSVSPLRSLVELINVSISEMFLPEVTQRWFRPSGQDHTPSASLRYKRRHFLSVTPLDVVKETTGRVCGDWMDVFLTRPQNVKSVGVIIKKNQVKNSDSSFLKYTSVRVNWIYLGHNHQHLSPFLTFYKPNNLINPENKHCNCSPTWYNYFIYLHFPSCLTFSASHDPLDLSDIFRLFILAFPWFVVVSLNVPPTTISD